MIGSLSVVLIVPLAIEGQAFAIRVACPSVFEADSCEAPTVATDGSCQFVYVGQGGFVTAAHCVDEPAFATATLRFGDDFNFPKATVAVDCFPRDEGLEAWDGSAGADLGVCIAAMPSNIPDLDVATPMVADECIVGYLDNELMDGPGYFDAMMASFGPKVGGIASFDEKNVGYIEIVGQYTWTGSSTMLRHLKSTSPSSCTSGVAVYGGDSGAPVYTQMPDGTFHLLSVHSGKHSNYVYEQAIPPFVPWIEEAIGEDVTPCWNLSEGQWLYVGGTVCRNNLPQSLDSGNTWNNECHLSSGDLGGPTNGCYGWTGDPSAVWQEPWVTTADWSDIADLAIWSAENGVIPAYQEDVYEFCMDVGASLAAYPFLGDEAIFSGAGISLSGASNSVAVEYPPRPLW